MKVTTDNNVFVSKLTSASVKDAVSSTETGNKRWVKASDALWADGVRFDMLTGKTKLTEVADAVKAAIVLGLTVAERKLLASDVKAMSETDKPKRKEAQQKMGRYVALIQTYLKGKALANGEIEPEEQVEKTTAEKIKIALDTAQKIVQGDEAPEGYDPIKMAKALTDAIALIK